MIDTSLGMDYLPARQSTFWLTRIIYTDWTSLGSGAPLPPFQLEANRSIKGEFLIPLAVFMFNFPDRSEAAYFYSTEIVSEVMRSTWTGVQIRAYLSDHVGCSSFFNVHFFCPFHTHIYRREAPI